jgi:hypothetical protein
MSVGMLLRAPSSPAFYVNDLTATTGAEHWPLLARAAISFSDSTCLPPSRGARPLLSDSGPYFHFRHKKAAVPRPLTQVPDAHNVAAPINSRLVPIFYTPAPLLPAHSGHLLDPTAFVYLWPTSRSPTTSACQLRVRTCVPLPRRTCRTIHCRHGGSPHTRATSSPITLHALLNSRLPKQNPLQSIARPPSGQRSAFSPQRHASPPAPRWPCRRPPHRDTHYSRPSL